MKSRKEQPPSEVKTLTFIDILSGKKIPPRRFYILTGSDPFAFSQLEKVFIQRFLSDDPSLFNRVIIECNANTKASEIINACEEYPFGARYRLVFAQYANNMKADEGEKLRRYLEDPSETAVLVISEDEEELKKASASKFYPSRVLRNEIKKWGMIILCTLNLQETKNWVKSQFESAGKEIDSLALNLMVEMIGNNLWDLSHEIEKAILYVGDKPRIGQKDIQTITSSRPQSKIFNLTEKVGLGDISSSIKILDELLREKTPAVMVLTSLNTHFVFLYQVGELMKRGESADNIAKKLHRHPFYIKKSMAQAQRLSESAYESIFDIIARADGGLKSGMDERMVLELTLIQICRQKG